MPHAGNAVMMPVSDETQALRALTTFCVLDTLPDERFDRITRIACAALSVPYAMVSLIDRDRRWIKSGQGLAGRAAEHWVALCASSVERDAPLVVEDATRALDFALHPLVVGPPRLRFYAGQPIHGPGGNSIGALCVMNDRPRVLSAADERLLGDLAALVEREIDLMEHATTDSLTRLSNRRGFAQVAAHVLAMCRRNRQPAVLVSLDLDHFKPINDRLGHEAGDRVLREFAKMLFIHFRDSDVVARLGGDEFAVLCSGTTTAHITTAFERLKADYAGSALAALHPELSWSAGVADFEPTSTASVEDLLRAADERLYRAKHHRHAVPGDGHG